MNYNEKQQAEAVKRAEELRIERAKRELRAKANLICEECAQPLRNKRHENQVVRFCSKQCRVKRDTGKEIENYGRTSGT